MFFKLLLLAIFHFLIVNGREESKNTMRRLKRNVVFKDEIFEYSWSNINFEKERQNDSLMLISVITDKSMGYIINPFFPYLTDKEPYLDCEAARNHEDFILSPSTAAFKIDFKAQNLLPFRTDTSPTIHLYPNRSRINGKINQTDRQMIQMTSSEFEGITHYNLSFAMFIDSEEDEGLYKIYLHFCDNVEINSGMHDPNMCMITLANDLDKILIGCVQLVGYFALWFFAWCDGYYTRLDSIINYDDDFYYNLITIIYRFECIARCRFYYYFSMRLMSAVLISTFSVSVAPCVHLNNYSEKILFGMTYASCLALFVWYQYFTIFAEETIPRTYHIMTFVFAHWCLNEWLLDRMYFTNWLKLQFVLIGWPDYLREYPIQNNPSSRIMEDLQPSRRLMKYAMVIYGCIPSFNMILAPMVVLGVPFQLYWIQYVIEDISLFLFTLTLALLNYRQFLVVKQAFDTAVNEANNNTYNNN